MMFLEIAGYEDLLMATLLTIFINVNRVQITTANG